ncbi:pentapeptide repeat-containing protein [Streptomyces sp. NPDC058476]|uniref:pentapeptide repeat-containing protein n=1 Tax=Streptomyces sp. NPDC058476 TaxID=3346519 RepID=UPI00364F2A3B
MTMLASLLDNYVSVALSPSPSIAPPSPQTSASDSPLWANLVVGVLGGLLGGTGVFAASWRSTRALRDNTRETLGHERTRLLNERFDTAARLLGHGEAACRLAGVHAMAGLADDWAERRQTCIDVLCAYLRMPYPPRPGEDAPVKEDLTWQANREIRHPVIRTIRDHLLPTTPPETSWSRYDLDFTGTVFDGGDFSDAKFSGGTVSFSGVEFSGGTVDFSEAKFSSDVYFDHAEFSSGTVDFGNAKFSGGDVLFISAKFDDGTVDFRGAMFSASIIFDYAQFSGGTVDFRSARFSGTFTSFAYVELSGGTVHFDNSWFSGGGVTFLEAEFSGAIVDFRRARGVLPPYFDDGVLTDPPPGLLLPDTPPEPAS